MSSDPALKDLTFAIDVRDEDGVELGAWKGAFDFRPDLPSNRTTFEVKNFPTHKTTFRGYTQDRVVEFLKVVRAPWIAPGLLSGRPPSWSLSCFVTAGQHSVKIYDSGIEDYDDDGVSFWFNLEAMPGHEDGHYRVQPVLFLNDDDTILLHLAFSDSDGDDMDDKLAYQGLLCALGI